MKTTKKSTIDVTDYEPSEAVLRKARKALSAYTLVVEPDADGGFHAWASELPSVIADGTSALGALQSLQFALETVLCSMVDDGSPLPTPASRAKRTEQINIRLTPYEKQMLARESARRGFKGVADLIRAQAIERLVRAAG